MIKKRSFLFLLIIFFIMLFINIMNPLSYDDYFLAFIWPEGLGINEILPPGTKKITDISDLYKSLKAYYLSWGGRIPGQSLMTFFVWQGKTIFNFLNSLIFLVLIAEIYWVVHEGRIEPNFKPNYIIWIFFSLWSFNIAFYDTFIWLSGSCEYLWMLVLLIAFLLPYIQNYYNKHLLCNDRLIFSIKMFLLGVLSGDSRETVICWIITILLYWTFKCHKENNLQYWKVSGLFGLCVGYSLLIFAPGNFSRLAIQNHMNGILITEDFLFFKMVQTLAILCFHFLLWYFLVKFFIIYSRNKHEFKKSENLFLYLNFAKICTILAFVSGMLMIFIPSGGFRPSLVTLVFLIVAAGTIFRASEKTGFFLFAAKKRVFMKRISCSYLVLTILFALIGNYLNWRHWNSIQNLVKMAQQNHTDLILEIEPYPIRDVHVIKLLSGFHINPMPFNGKNEDDPIKYEFIINEKFNHMNKQLMLSTNC